jgi:hypothetical protein
MNHAGGIMRTNDKQQATALRNAVRNLERAHYGTHKVESLIAEDEYRAGDEYVVQAIRGAMDAALFLLEKMIADREDACDECGQGMMI